MEQRVSKLETDVAVLGQRTDTLEAEVSVIRSDLASIKKQIATAQGLILATVVIMQVLAVLLEQ
tara:strand:+ start:393 stop:584 length:192 start_codon:yes stop_codon:yes gene_type:complete